ncbi:MAG: enolase C-terminal domain-like protein [Thermodesulfobacteriota bacterium]|nr:enolase C-terminal domain-like protein [Thermodesulfobacteriota bacterium]
MFSDLSMDATLSVLRHSIPLTSAYKLSFGPVRSFDTFYVVLRAEGRIGAGEITPLPGYSSETPESVARELTDFADNLEKGLPFSKLLQDMAKRSPFTASGVACAYETRLEGPKAAFSAPVPKPIPLAGFCGGDTPERSAECARKLLQQGYSTLKMKVGAMEPLGDAARVRAVAGELLPGCVVRLDANQAYTPDQALAFCREIEDIQAVELLEQPFSPEMWLEHEKLIEQTRLSIMLDESIWTEDDLQRASDCGAKLVKSKLCKHLGMDGSKKMVKSAIELGLGVVYGNGVQTALGNHLEARVYHETDLSKASEGNGFLKPLDSPLRHEITVQNGMLVDNGIQNFEAAFERGTLAARAKFSLEP